MTKSHVTTICIFCLMIILGDRGTGEDMGKLVARDPILPCSLVVSVKRQGLPVCSQWTRQSQTLSREDSVRLRYSHFSSTFSPAALHFRNLNGSCICSTKILCLCRNCISLPFLLANKNKMKQKKIFQRSEASTVFCALRPALSAFKFLCLH